MSEEGGEGESLWAKIFAWYNILLVINAVLGVCALEWAWWKLRRFRKPIAELDLQFPELARKDAPKWKKWKLYPGALTLLIPRILFVIVIGLLMVLLLNLVLICHDTSRPIRGCRKVLISGIMYIGTNLVSLVGWFTYLGHAYVTESQVDHYEEYLGTVEEQQLAQAPETAVDERVPKRGPGPCSTVICNHIGQMEILNLVASPLRPGFTPKADIKKIPIVRGIANAIQSIFIERAGSKADRD